LGSNIGESHTILVEALSEISAVVDGVRSSPIYRSQPRYVSKQPDFLNLVASCQTDASPLELLARMQVIEAQFGRDRSHEQYKGPRTLDIDILLFGSEIIKTDVLLIPHPGMLERAFVLVPLVELMPTLRHPETGHLFTDYLGEVAGQGIYLHAKAPL
jgi:2-amino-4-hydroxy-6-hydroxymethyldihydropteridine diphosphokinase